jgi:hypothetical protein
MVTYCTTLNIYGDLYYNTEHFMVICCTTLNTVW